VFKAAKLAAPAAMPPLAPKTGLPIPNVDPTLPAAAPNPPKPKRPATAPPKPLIGLTILPTPGILLKKFRNPLRENPIRQHQDLRILHLALFLDH